MCHVFVFLVPSQTCRRDQVRKDAAEVEQARLGWSSRIAELENELCESKSLAARLEIVMVKWRKTATGSHAKHMHVLKHAVNIMDGDDSEKKAALRRYVLGRLRPGDDLALPFL